MSSEFEPVILFYSYAPEDEGDRVKLEKHLILLEREALIKSWHVGKIIAGSVRDAEVIRQLNSAQLILLLVSVDFIASSACYDFELKRAMERHFAKEAWVLPIIL